MFNQHDTYAERMNTLSVIYNIPLPPHSPPSLHTSSSVSSAGSTQPSSPVSVSPTSDTSDRPHLHDHEHDAHSDDSEGRNMDDDEEGAATAVPTVTTFTQVRTPTTASSSTANSPVHPYAMPAIVSSHQNGSSAPSNRMSVVTTPTRLGRPRALSNLPPPAPPPTSVPPPAPAPSSNEPSSDPPLSATLRIPDAGRSRGNSITHKRTGSNSRLAALQEETERQDGQPAQTDNSSR